jgi:AraC-like DNA-binding protein
MDSLSFTLPQALALLGVAQCAYIVTYMALRAGRLSRAGVPIAYFCVLGLAFALDFGHKSWSGFLSFYEDLQWLTWYAGPPLSVLLIIQIAQIHTVPNWRRYWIMALVPLAYAGAQIFSDSKQFADFLVITGLLAGGISLLTLWLNRDILKPVALEKNGGTRFWLIMALITMNILFLGLALASVIIELDAGGVILTRTVLGLGLVYVAGTSLFRIYPQAINLIRAPALTLSDEDRKIAAQIENLLTLDKVYHEPTYSRAKLAQECGTSEANLSRILNTHFGKTLPQLLNEYRVADAKRLLTETDAPVKIVAAEVGFNALPSFNRVFKDMTGVTPSKFRRSN